MSTANGRPDPPQRIIRFPPFELDVRAAELRKHGIKVRLHDQPFRILLNLLSRPGEVVLREEIRKVLWPDDTVVEFDRSINAAIQRLRDALGDSAENPRYVETLARRGYRFIGAVKPAEAQPRQEPAQPPVGRGGYGSGKGRHSYWPAAAGLCLLLAATALLWRQHPAPPARAVEFEVLPPGDSGFGNPDTATAVSPDGRWIVFRAQPSGEPVRLWLRPLDSPVARPLAGTEEGNSPFWSPDSKSLAFFALGKLKRMEIAGGPPVTLCDALGGDGGSWSTEGVILFAGDQRNLMRISAAGGPVAKVTQADPARREIKHMCPQFLPDGKHFLYLIKGATPSTTGTYIGSLDHPEERRRLLPASYKALYAGSPGGGPEWLLWLRQQTLTAQRFDAGRLRLIGEPAVIAEDVMIDRFDEAAFWVSDAGVLVYHSGSINSALSWVSREGKILETVEPGGRFDALALSPDGKRVALCRSDADNYGDVWIYEFARKTMTRLTFDSAPVDSPVWSPDGRQLAFASGRSGAFQIYRKNVDGSGQQEQLTDGPAENYPEDWSRDGKYLLFQHSSLGKPFGIWLFPLEGTGNPVALLEGPFKHALAVFSPDTKWIAYYSWESGSLESYVRAFDASSSVLGGKVQISAGWGGWPRWRSDGKEIFYHHFRNPFSWMFARIRTTNGGIEAAAPVPMFRLTGLASDTARTWDVAADGQHFLITQAVGPHPHITRLNVVVNWQTRANR